MPPAPNTTFEAGFKITPLCVACGDPFSSKRRLLGYTLCLECGDQKAKQTKHTILTPHKQGAMYFTTEFAREAAMGINNKGGLVK